MSAEPTEIKTQTQRPVGVGEAVAGIDVVDRIVSADRDYTPVAVKEAYVKLLPDARLVVIVDDAHGIRDKATFEELDGLWEAIKAERQET